MTREDTKKILMIVQTSYSNWHPVDLGFAINTWTSMLSEYSYQEVADALKTFILSDTKGFAPSIGQLVDKIHLLRESSGEQRYIGELEAWAMVYKAICNSNYNAEAEFQKLPDMVQKAVGTPANLTEWAKMDVETVQSVEQSHFIRSYRATVEREKENAKLPQEIRQRLEMTHVELLNSEQGRTVKENEMD